MIPTATVLAFFAWAYVFGLELGLCYGFLRPLRPRHTGAADLLFLLALYRKAAVLMFGVCGGELRPACLLVLFLGIWSFDRTAGRLLRPLFAGFWKIAGRLRRLVARPLKKISQIAKNMFASGENGLQ